MKRAILAIVAAICFVVLPGCGNLSPRLDPKLDQKIDNQNGKIDEIKNNQNGVMAEIGTLKNQAEIQNSQLEKIQQGMFNLQNNNDNHGVQILSGSGGLLIALVGILASVVIILHYRKTAQMHEKTANILAQRIADLNDPGLEDAVFTAAMYTDVEENVLNLMKKVKKTSALP